MMMRQIIYLMVASVVTLASGCSQNSRSLSDTVRLAFLGPADTNISSTQINQLSYDSLLVQQEDSPDALLVLAWVEKGHRTPAMKWLSAGQEMIITEAGRIVKTINLGPGNVVALESAQPDPLSLGLQHPDTPRTWDFRLSWQPGYHFGYPAHAQFKIQGQTTLTLATGETRKLLYVTEQIRIPIIRQDYTNEYWLDPHTGEVIKTSQQPAPHLARMTLTVTKALHGGNQ
jgi:hypothetical protein